MSVMPAMVKKAMGPQLLSAVIGSESHATSAALSSALVTKMFVARRRPLVVGTGMLAARSDERGKSCAVSSDGNPEPLTLESIIARWMSIAYRGPCIDLLDAL
eukprot:scaffold54410_cov44-Phaeocystis_antarctica.AAC.1